MYLIRVYADFLRPNEIKPIFDDRFSTQFIENYGRDKDIYITDKDDYTHVIIINTAMPNLKPSVPKQNVIGLAYEPNYSAPFLNITPQFIEYAEKYIGKYFVGDLFGLSEPFIETPAYLTYSVPSWKLTNKTIDTIIQQKSKRMSIMISDKVVAPGHLYREQLVKEILKTDVQVDIYGRGCKRFQTTVVDPRLKGTFENNEPYLDYQFHISIENFQSSCYYSEKVLNPIMYGTIPIYLGCYNIDDFLPEKTIIHLKYDIEQDMKLIRNIIENTDKYWKNIDVEKIEKSMNLFKNIEKVFE
jgi:hypothetical protein